MARSALRLSDLKATLRVLLEGGLRPQALEVFADGRHRWILGDSALSEDIELDQELAAFEAKMGTAPRQGKAKP